MWRWWHHLGTRFENIDPARASPPDPILPRRASRVCVFRRRALPNTTGRHARTGGLPVGFAQPPDAAATLTMEGYSCLRGFGLDAGSLSPPAPVLIWINRPFGSPAKSFVA
jgi:hypothetical protein